MSYWPHSYSEDASEWGTNYAGHFLLEAQNHGYNVPSGLLEKWKQYQRNMARNYNGTGKFYGYAYEHYDLIQAYRLYLLALAGTPEMGAMNRLRENNTTLLQAKWMLAAAYFQAGQKAIAYEITKNLPTNISAYREMDYSYGSDFRDEAMMLETMTMMGDYTKAYNIVDKLSQIMRGNGWLSTQETAYGLMAMAKYAGKKGTAALDVEYKLNDGNWTSISGKSCITQINLELNKKGKGTIEVRNKNKTPIFTNLVLTGIPEAEKEVAEQKNVNMDVSYTDTKGNIIDPSKLKQGTDFIAEVRISNPGNEELDNMALSVIIPSGWQIYNPRMTGNQFAIKTSKPEYTDIRDDRVFLFYSMEGYCHRYYRNDGNDNENNGGEEKEEGDDANNAENATRNEAPDHSNSQVFRIALNASFVGKYYMPGIYTEAMYNKNIHSQTSGKWITVTKSNSPAE